MDLLYFSPGGAFPSVTSLVSADKASIISHNGVLLSPGWLEDNGGIHREIAHPG